MSSGQILPGGYRLERLIGRGGFAEVWRAVAPGGLPVAVKITAPHGGRQSELRALKVLMDLCHPSLLRPHASWEDQGRLYVVMDLAEGSLRDRLHACRGGGQDGLPAAELVRHLGEAADALGYLHRQGMLHRNVKPDNMLLAGGRVRLAGFVLAHPYDGPLVSASLAGTPAYMAPEVWRGQAGPPSDQYALACSYAELRLGRRPLGGTDLAGMMQAHLEHEPDLGALPEAERRVLGRGLAKDPGRRFPNCVELALALGRSSGNPFRPLRLDSGWRTPVVVSIARRVHDEDDAQALAVLADALEGAGCTEADLLAHCRGPGPHGRGCFVLDLILGEA